MIKQLVATLLVTISLQTFAIGTKVIKGKFEYNKLINEAWESDSLTRTNFALTLDSINIQLLEEYMTLLINFSDYEAAEKLIKTDPFLNEIPDRVRSIFYLLYYVNKAGLLFHPCISLSNEQKQTLRIVYMSEQQFKKINSNLNEEIILRVNLVTKVELINTTIYKMTE